MPSPHKRSFAAEELARRQQKRPATIAIIVIAVIIAAVAVGYALYMRLAVKKVPTESVVSPAEEIKSIAVLPFVDMSPAKDQEYLGDGIADTIISTLSQLNALHVIARTSSFEFRGKENVISKIGEKLRVDAVLEGSVQKSGDRLRIIAQLINVADQTHIFSKTYDSEMKDIFTIQDSISMAVVEEIKGRLLKNEIKAIEKRYTNNVKAYELYLMGWNSKGIDIKKQLEYLQRAVALDPNFALAYVRSAEILYRLGHEQKWKEMLNRALAIDPNLSEAHVVRANIMFRQYDWDGAEKEYKRAVELNPGNEEAHRWYANFLRYMKRGEEALKENTIALKLNPLYMSAYAEMIAINLILERYDDAIGWFDRGIEVDPNDVYIYRHLGRLYCKQGRYEEAIKAFERIRDGAPQSEFWQESAALSLNLTYAYKNENGRAESYLKELLKRKEQNESVLSSSIALIYTALGNHDAAIDWLERAYREHDGGLRQIYPYYEFDPLHSNPRFKALMMKMGLPEN